MRSHAEKADPVDFRGSLPARRKRPCRRAAQQRDEFAPFGINQVGSVPSQAGAESQDIELARISQEVIERFYNLSAIGGYGADVRSSVIRVNSTPSGQSQGLPPFAAFDLGLQTGMRTGGAHVLKQTVRVVFWGSSPSP